MGNSLAKIFTLKKTNTDTPKSEPTDEKSESTTTVSFTDIKTLKLTYYQAGYGESKGAMGSSEVLESSLHSLYENYREECRRHLEEQENLKKPYREKLLNQSAKVKAQSTLIDIRESELENSNKSLDELKDTYAQVDADPAKFGVDADKRPKAQFYIGLLVLLPITLYLIVFYVSASYSAFFKTFTTDQISEAIFDAQALTKALQDGTMEFLFVLTMPFAFMGLGYLIHMFQKKKARLKIAGIVIITFVFDLILAYQIDKKTYEMNKTFDSLPYDLSYAVQSVQFWGIIFAGFVVYIIWGLVFDFIMAEYDNFDKVKKFKEALSIKIENLKEKITEQQAGISKLRQELTDYKNEEDNLRQRLNGFIFNQREYLVLHTEYFKGWLYAIMKEIALPHKEQDILVENCKKTQKAFLLGLNLTGENEIDTINYIDESK